LAAVENARAQSQTARTLFETETRRKALEADLEASARAQEEAFAAAQDADREEALWTQLVEAVKAAALADGLSAGEPCPVCGSSDHPHPAVWPEASAEAPRRLEVALATQATARQALAVAQARGADLKARWEDIPPAVTGATTPETAAIRLGEAQARVDALQAWTRARDAARRAADAAGTAEALARSAWQAAVRDREVWTTRRASLSEAVPGDPGPRLAATVREEGELRRALDDDRRKAETLGRDQGALVTRIEEQEKQLVTQREEFARLKVGLDTAVAALGWTMDEVKAARRNENELKSLEATVATFDRDDHRLDGETAALEAKFPGGEPEPIPPAV
jgi:exonuclease SbcC